MVGLLLVDVLDMPKRDLELDMPIQSSYCVPTLPTYRKP